MPTFPRVQLILRPTPLHRLPRISEDLGLDLWIKRDDLTGFAMGGNKGRKIEYLIADALTAFGLGLEGAPFAPRERHPSAGRQAPPYVMVTAGAAQSNFVRQLGAACAMFGLGCAAAVMRLPYFKAAGRPKLAPVGSDGGNLLLDEMLGVDVRWYPDGDWQELEERAEELAREYEERGRRVYRVPVGGSSPLSAYAFFEAAREAEEQAGPFDVVVTPSSSGSTHAGLAYYHFRPTETDFGNEHGTSQARTSLRRTDRTTRVIGVCADDDPEGELHADIVHLCQQLDRLTGLRKAMRPEHVELRMEWFGDGYNVPSEAGARAIELLARREGVFLDPVYTGKAFAGLLDLARSGEISGRVLFWHTGGVPTLFAR